MSKTALSNTYFDMLCKASLPLLKVLEILPLSLQRRLNGKRVQDFLESVVVKQALETALQEIEQRRNKGVKIIEKVGGKIKAESEEGVESTFRLYILAS